MDAWLIPLARGLHVGAMLVVFGTLVSRVAFGAGNRPRRAMARLVCAGFALSVLAGLSWLAVETAEMAWTGSLGDTVLVAPTVATQTHFGGLLLLRILLLAMAVAWAGRLGSGSRAAIAAVLSGSAVALQAWTGHAAAASDGSVPWLAAVETLHVLAAGAWLGALPSLLLDISASKGTEAVIAARRFTWLGVPAVLLLGATGLVQSEQLIGGLPALFGTTYGHIALLKIGLFIALIVLALLNRFSLTARPREFRASIATETLLGALVLMAAALLASALPGAHDSPVWPFPSRPTWQALTDPAARQGVLLGIIGSALALLLAGWGLMRRRISVLATGTILAVLSLPHLGPLLAEAYPTTFEHAPDGFSARSIVAGADLFALNCASCHGAGGAGDGVAASSLPVQPADLQAPHLLQHTEGDLFWFISTGFTAPGGAVAMPGFAPALSDEARWNLVQFLLARNAGARFAASGRWQPPIHAPDFPITCGNHSTTLAELRGRPVLLAASREPVATEDIQTVPLEPRPDLPNQCAAASPDVMRAYGLLIDRMPEADFLVDAQGWVREYWYPDSEAGLRARVEEIRRNPLPEPSMPSGHVH